MNPLANRAALDLDTVVTVLYVAGLEPADWHRAGPAAMAQFVTAVAADPRCRMPELVTLVGIARHLGPPWVLADYLAQVEAYAPVVQAVLSN